MPHNILVADDDPHIREIICFALEKAGMKTHAVSDGAAALQAVERRPPDLIVLDIGMPEMDGLEVCRRLRQRCDIPVLFLSARDEEIDRILGLEMGGDDYVTKPFSPRVLTAIEFAIVKGFLARPQHVLGRDAVMANAYQSNIHVSDRTVDSHIRNIRAKLAAAGCNDAIETVHGVGFRLGRCGG
ncbi:MAG: response regulator transcription factor [Mesorhizobium sp.]|nr:MAG: response regulator transcription factor [Mesorhizobium sp.]